MCGFATRTVAAADASVLIAIADNDLRRGRSGFAQRRRDPTFLVPPRRCAHQAKNGLVHLVELFTRVLIERRDRTFE